MSLLWLISVTRREEGGDGVGRAVVQLHTASRPFVT